jgi:hypothetical protein
LLLKGSERSVLGPNRFVEEAVEVGEGPARHRHDGDSESGGVEWLERSRLVECVECLMLRRGAVAWGGEGYIPPGSQLDVMNSLAHDELCGLCWNPASGYQMGREGTRKSENELEPSSNF